MTSEDPQDPARAGDLPDAVVDARFAELVADWDPALPTDRPTPPEVPEESPSPAAGTPIVLDIPVWRGPTTPTPFETVEDELDEEGYTPGPVDLPPGEDLHYWGAVAGLVLGPVLVLYVAFARPFYATWWLLAGLGLFVGGFLLLVLRGPARREEDDPDAGARV